MTSIRVQLDPTTSTPSSFNSASAASTISLVNASAATGCVNTVAPSRFKVLLAISTVRSHAAWLIYPTPSADGQMRPLISFICHSW